VSSVAAAQLRETWPRPPVAVSDPGALGGAVSGFVTARIMSPLIWLKVSALL
jgi:hypothetical protein